jgi:hypothetical protein
VPIRTERVCIKLITREPKIKMARRFNLDEKIVTKINVYIIFKQDGCIFTLSPISERKIRIND